MYMIHIHKLCAAVLHLLQYMSLQVHNINKHVMKGSSIAHSYITLEKHCPRQWQCQYFKVWNFPTGTSMCQYPITLRFATNGPIN